MEVDQKELLATMDCSHSKAAYLTRISFRRSNIVIPQPGQDLGTLPSGATG